MRPPSRKQAPSPARSTASSRRTPDSVNSTSARFGFGQDSRLQRPQAGSAKAKVGSLARPPVNYGRVAPKKRAKEDLLIQDRRRTSVIHVDEDIGSELEAAPERKKSMSRANRLSDDDFDDFSEAEPGSPVPAKGSSSDSGGWTPSFAGRSAPNTPQTADEEEPARGGPPVSGSRRIEGRPSSAGRSKPSPGRAEVQTFMSDEDEEDSSPVASKAPPKVPQITLPVPALSKRVETRAAKKVEPRQAQSFLSDSESDTGKESPVAVAAVGSLPILMEEPVDLSTSPLWEASPPTASELQSAPAQVHETRTLPEVQEAVRKNSRSESPKHVTLMPEAEVELVESRETSDERGVSEEIEELAEQLEPDPTAKVSASPFLDASPSKVFASPVSDTVGRGEELGSSPEAAGTTASNGGTEPRSMTNGSPRSPWGDDVQDPSDPSQLKSRLEELEEQQLQIQKGLTQALEYERRLRADELARCQSLTVELAEALEQEQKRHAEEIQMWEQRLRSQLQAHEAKWLAEVEALQAEVSRLRSTRPAQGGKADGPSEGSAKADGHDPMTKAPEGLSSTKSTARLTFQDSISTATLEAPTVGDVEETTPSKSTGGGVEGSTVQSDAMPSEPITMPKDQTSVPRLNLSLAAWQALDASPRSSSSPGRSRPFPAPVVVETPKASAGVSSPLFSPSSRYTDSSSLAQARPYGTPRSGYDLRFPSTYSVPMELPAQGCSGYTFGRSILVPTTSEAGRSPSSSPVRAAAQARLLSPARTELRPASFFPAPQVVHGEGEAALNLTPSICFSLGKPQVNFEMPRSLRPL